ncbi:hypothetical protein [Methylophilus aquaticus]|uniref:PEP-CTERM sorting domain-containing protein n=1 Tax=Methylophilus aquaticus TaxID=1971610 RepID=A0ABT9JSH1_9PROT|nr:hypothetical protein [Methylophilus aquaticus]MDP8567414.1 hypothetical protein [Methylophilus aquaticus]
MQINATFTAKTTAHYINDALFATTGAGSGVAAARWAAAAADVQLVRNGSYTDIAVSSPLQASKTPELEAAQRLLTAARDSATLLTNGATDTSYNSRFALTRQLWDMAATVDPSLGKSLAGYPSDALTSTDLAAEVAVLKMVLNGVQDNDFTTQLDSLLAQPMVTGSTALLTLDGALLGLNNALLSVYYLGNASSGTVDIDLLAADRYAFFRNGFDRASLLEGSANGLTVIGNDNYAGTQLTLDSGETYIGEVFNGLLQLSGDQTASKLQLNNFYTNQLFVVASFGVLPSPVPEPNAALLLSGGWLLLSRMRKRFQQSR